MTLHVLQALDDGGGDAAVAGDEGVGVAGGGDELLFRLGGHFDDLRADGVEGLALDRVAGIGEVVGDPAGRFLDDDLELGWHDGSLSSRMIGG